MPAERKFLIPPGGELNIWSIYFGLWGIVTAVLPFVFGGDFLRSGFGILFIGFGITSAVCWALLWRESTAAATCLLLILALGFIAGIVTTLLNPGSPIHMVAETFGVIFLAYLFGRIFQWRESLKNPGREIKSQKTFTVRNLVLLVAVVGFAVLDGTNDPRKGPPTKQLVKRLDSDDLDEVIESYYYLERRSDPIAVAKAISHLKSEDDYLWLNAADYLGACGEQEAVPYLIKALRHSASRANEVRIGYLNEITGKDFGPDFDAWKMWWEEENPNEEFDWVSYLGPRPRIGEGDTEF